MVHTYVQQFIQWVIGHGGLYMIAFILFAETGLFLDFFLPGDSLLFAAGLYLNELARTFLGSPLWLIILLLVLATAAGSYLGYFIGYRSGNYLFQKKDSFLFKKKHLYRAQYFYSKHGKSTVFLSKLLPVIRTFAPLVGGITKMPVRFFSLYNWLGSICWVLVMVLSGYYLQTFVLKKYGFDLKEHIEYITLIIILVTTLPIVIKFFVGKDRRTQPQQPQF